MEISNEIEFNAVKAITHIAKRLASSQLKEELIEKINIPLQELSDYLKVTKNQSIIFCVIFVLQVKLYSIELRDIISFLEINYIDSLNLKADIDKLVELNLIEAESDFKRKERKANLTKCSFAIQNDVSDSIYANEPIVQKDKEQLDIYIFVNKVSNYIEKRVNGAIETDELFNKVQSLESNNEHLKPIQNIKHLLGIEDRTLLYEIIDDHILGYPSSMDKTLKDIYENAKKKMLKIRELVDKTNRMFELDFITLGESRYANDSTLNLTSTSLEFFLAEDAELFMRNKKYKNVLLNEDISYKELFYESNLAKEVNFLTDSLQNENFSKLQERLTDMHLSKGVAAIFYGKPGTGKTETCYQIAKATGRDILLVDISQSKSMWFGESEKKIKEIFDTYKRICSSMEVKPILLFNEADAILNKRQENGHSNVAQTENAIQNILLEELEKFEGIMIATTNLAGNLDAAYERRFLFKIKFETPTVEVKSKIWQNKLTWLDGDSASKLANDFSFSGGEIDNIVRKITMQEVLTGNRPDSNEIFEYCHNEKQLSKNNGKFKVGYA